MRGPHAGTGDLLPGAGDTPTVGGFRRRTFERRLRGLSRGELAAFVADLWTARGRDTTVQDGTVIIRDPATGLREVAVVVPVGETRRSGAGLPPAADIIVTPTNTRAIQEHAAAMDARVVDAAGLARLLRYAVTADDAERVVATHLGPPPWTDGIHAYAGTISADAVAAIDRAAGRPTVRAVSILALVTVLVVAGVGGSLAGGPGLDGAQGTITPVDPTSISDSDRFGPSTQSPGSVDGLGMNQAQTVGGETASSTAGTSWQTLGGGPTRSGFRAGIDGPRRNVTRGGRLSLGVPVQVAPVVADGRLYVAQVDGTVHAIDAQTMAPVWNRSLRGDSAAGITLAEGTLFVGTALGAEAPIASRRGHTLTALHAENGTVRWSVEMASIHGTPAVVNGTVYVGTVEGWVHALDAKSGAIRWSASFHRTIRASPAVAGDTVYVPDVGGGVTALDTTIGRIKWETDLPGSIESAPAVVGRTVYVGTTAGTVHALNASNGVERWRRTVGANFGATVWGTPAVAYGTVFVASADGRLTALDARTGRDRWTALAAGSLEAGPVVAGYVVYVAGREGPASTAPASGRVVAYEAETGRERWSHTTDGPVVAQPALTDDALYIVDGLGRVDRLDSCVDWRGLDIDRRGPESPPHCQPPETDE